jgi:hypothetical protein
MTFVLKSKEAFLKFAKSEAGDLLFNGQYPEKILSSYKAAEAGLPVFSLPIIILKGAKKTEVENIIKSLSFPDGNLRIFVERNWKTGEVIRSQGVLFSDENYLENSLEIIESLWESHGYAALQEFPVPTQFDYVFSIFLNPKQLSIEYMPAGCIGGEVNKGLLSPAGIVSFKNNGWGRETLSTHKFEELTEEEKEIYYRYLPTTLSHLSGMNEKQVQDWLIDNGHYRIAERNGPMSLELINQMRIIAKSFMNKDWYILNNAPTITLFGQVYKGKIGFYGYMSAKDSNL